MFTHTASAADMAVKAPAAVPQYSWTGFYIGGNLGYGWGHVDSTIDEPLLARIGAPASYVQSTSPDGLIGGGQIGYNWQISPQWVVGIEADIQGAAQKDTGTLNSSFSTLINGTPFFGTLAQSHEEKLEWFATARARIGYLFWNNTMLYATGGLAHGHFSTSWSGTSVTNLGVVPSTTAYKASAESRTGWTVGAGIEGALFDVRNWTWKIEYLYMDLGSWTVSNDDQFNFRVVTFNNKLTDNIVRVGLNYQIR